MDFYVSIILIVAVLIAGVTLFLCDYEKERLIKFIPFLVMIFSGFIFMMAAILFVDGLKELAFVVLATMNYVAALCSLSTASTITVVRRINKSSKKKGRK